MCPVAECRNSVVGLCKFPESLGGRDTLRLANRGGCRAMRCPNSTATQTVLAGWHTPDPLIIVNTNGLDESCCYRTNLSSRGANRDVSDSISRSNRWPALHTNLQKIPVKFLMLKTSESFTYCYLSIRKSRLSSKTGKSEWVGGVSHVTCCYHPFRRNGVQEVRRFDFIPCLSKGFLEEIPCVSLLQRKFVRGLKGGFAGDATVINPEISSGLPLPSVNRYPQPASRPEKYSTPATKGACLTS